MATTKKKTTAKKKAPAKKKGVRAKAIKKKWREEGIEGCIEVPLTFDPKTMMNMTLASFANLAVKLGCGVRIEFDAIPNVVKAKKKK